MESLYKTSYEDFVVAASKEGKLLFKNPSTKEVEILNTLRGQHLKIN